MPIKSQTQNLTSAFLIASLAFTLITPQGAGVSLGVTEPEDTGETGGFTLTDHPFAEPTFLEFKEYTEHIMVQDTGFLAIKNPPNKKQVVISRMWLFVTAYSSTPDQTDDTPFITASGTHVRDGVVAANFLPIGAKIRLPTMYGDKIFIVEDRMNSRYTYRVDIWMRTREEAKQFGLRNLPIEIIREI
jgi:3D (Asp-Asp-Asp) domain-containing protein